MDYRFLFFMLIFICSCQEDSSNNKEEELRTSVKSNETLTTESIASPPMGWKSSTNMDEATIKANAEYLSKALQSKGWSLVVIDTDWYSSVDNMGMPIVNAQRFPSSTNNEGLKSLSTYIHDQGLKFGVSLKKEVFNAQQKNADFIKKLIQVFSEWRIDYVSIVGLTSDYDQQLIQTFQQAMDQKMMLSIEGGATSLKVAQQVKYNTNSWTINSAPIQDWSTLKQAFAWCRPWQLHISNGHWASLGTINIDNNTLTNDELRTLLSLSSIFRSPLLLTGSLIDLDEKRLSLLTNKEVYAVNQFCKNSEELYIAPFGIVWATEDQKSNDRYVALFNTSEETQSMRVDWALMGWNGTRRVRDLWAGEDLGHFEGTYFALVPPHGAGMFRVYLQ